MRGGGGTPYNTLVSDAPEPPETDGEPDRHPLKPIPLPPDPLGRWLDGEVRDAEPEDEEPESGA